MRPELDDVFAAQFTGLVFDLGRGVRVEAGIDAVEALERGSPLARCRIRRIANTAC